MEVDGNQGSLLEELSDRNVIFCIHGEDSDKNPVPLTHAEVERLKMELRRRNISLSRVDKEGLVGGITTNIEVVEDAATSPEVLAVASLEALIGCIENLAPNFFAGENIVITGDLFPKNNAHTTKHDLDTLTNAICERDGTVSGAVTSQTTFLIVGSRAAGQNKWSDLVFMARSTHYLQMWTSFLQSWQRPFYHPATLALCLFVLSWLSPTYTVVAIEEMLMNLDRVDHAYTPVTVRFVNDLSKPHSVCWIPSTSSTRS